MGAPIANRTTHASESLIGILVNELVLRVDISGSPTFETLVQRVRDVAVTAFDHQELPFEELVAALRPEREALRNPYFETAFAFQNAPREAFTLVGAEVERIDLDVHGARFDLELHLWEAADGRFRGRIAYATDVLDRETIEQFAENYVELLTRGVARPASSVYELCRATGQNPTGVSTPVDSAFVDDAVRTWAENTPEAIAVSDGRGSVTYAELDSRVQAVADSLVDRGIGRNDRVGLHLDNCVFAIAALLGILRAGAAYVPLHTRIPTARVQQIVEDANLRVMIVDGSSTAAIGRCEALVEADLNGVGAPSQRQLLRCGSDTAYIIFTSGSTGRPKGVAIDHRALAYSTAARSEYYQERVEKFLMLSPIAFDSSVAGIFWTLTDGGTLRVAEEDERRDPNALATIITSEAVSHVLCVPPLYAAILRSAGTEGWPRLRTAIVAGETVPPRLVYDHYERHPGVSLYNEYGPTETTVWATAAFLRPCTEAARVPIGTPAPHARCYVLDETVAPVFPDVLGELFIGGAGVASGYLGLPEETRTRFRTDPFAKDGFDRMYATGDRARIRRDGSVEFFGRLDNQVKIRGNRIELEDVEGAIESYRAVLEAAVTLSGEGDHEGLTAFVTLKPDARAVDASPGYVASWRSLYEEIYAEAAAAKVDPQDNFYGWNATSSGAPFPKSVMTSWVETATERILANEPHSVLEIGCGNGLLVLRLMHSVERIVGTNISEVAVKHLRRLTRDEQHVDVRHLAADEIGAALRDERFDMIVLNSVVQYFADGDYLPDVLAAATQLLSDNGVIFVGDVRNLATARAFYAELEPTIQGAALLSAVAERADREDELLVDPAFFVEIGDALGFPVVEILSKPPDPDSELSRHRYDVFLRRADAPSLPTRFESIVDAIIDCNALAEEAVATGQLVVAHVVDSRLRRALERLGRQTPPFVDATSVFASAARAGGRAIMTPPTSTSPGRVVFGPAMDWHYDLKSLNARAPMTNEPTRSRRLAETETLLRRHLADRIPTYMTPSAFAFVEALPRTTNGKLDRKALAKAVKPSVRRRPSGVPLTEKERLLCDAWAIVLSLDSVGVDDGFFDLGGNSLQAVIAAARSTQILGKRVSVRAMFTYTSVRRLTAYAAELEPSVAQALPEPSARLRRANDPHETRSEPRIDAAVINYLRSEVLSATSGARERVRNTFSGEPRLTQIFDTGIGRLGVITLPFFDDELFDDQSAVAASVAAAIDLSGRHGARSASAAGDLAAVTDLGRAVSPISSLHLGTGHATTAASMVHTLLSILQLLDREPAKQRVLVVGTGDLVFAATDVLAREAGITACTITDPLASLDALRRSSRKLSEATGMDVAYAIQSDRAAVRAATAIFAASPLKNVLEVDTLTPGAVLVDDAMPMCVDASAAIRRMITKRDVIAAEAGFVRLPGVSRRIRSAFGIDYAVEDHGCADLTSCAFSALLNAFAGSSPVVGPVQSSQAAMDLRLMRSLRAKTPEARFAGYVLPRSLYDAVSRITMVARA